MADLFNHDSAIGAGKLSRIRRKFRPLQLLYLLGLLSIVGFTSGAALALVLSMTPLKHRVTHLPDRASSLSTLPAILDHPLNILVLGIDNSGHPHQGNFTPIEALAGNSDTMLLVRLVPRTHQINVLSIPRDTQVQLPQVGTDKINDANVRGGIQLAAQAVSQMASGLPIDRYIRLDTEGFVHLVDTLGSVEVNVPKAMNYEDHSQNLHIHFAAGNQRLGGQQLEEYIRFRHDEWGDIGRVQRQQDALKAILREALQPATLSKLPQLIQVTQTNLDTDLSVGEMLAIMQFLGNTDLHHANFVMLPGRFSRPDESALSYWIQDTQATTTILNRYFDLPSSALTVDSKSIPLAEIRIAVASNQPALREQVLARLKHLGFTSAYITDHEIDSSTDSLQETQIIAQQGNPVWAEQVRQALGRGKVEVSSVGDLASDVTLIVGADLNHI